jgi:hypothetical protein
MREARRDSACRFLPDAHRRFSRTADGLRYLARLKEMAGKGNPVLGDLR